MEYRLSPDYKTYLGNNNRLIERIVCLPVWGVGGGGRSFHNNPVLPSPPSSIESTFPIFSWHQLFFAKFPLFLEASGCLPLCANDKELVVWLGIDR